VAVRARLGREFADPVQMVTTWLDDEGFMCHHRKLDGPERMATAELWEMAEPGDH
jgi:hypothetical protein